jgi:hypothetical protein
MAQTDGAPPERKRLSGGQQKRLKRLAREPSQLVVTQSRLGRPAVVAMQHLRSTAYDDP